MKKFIPALLVTLLCASAGCDTRVESESIQSAMDVTLRCEMTGGIPIETAQAGVIRDLIRVINTNDCWMVLGDSYLVNPQCSEYSKTLMEDLESLGASDISTLNTFDATMESIKKEVNGGIVSYNTKPMASLYKVVSGLVPEGSGQNSAFYCACGYEFCEQGSSCVFDSATQLPICALSTSAGASANETCDPVVIKSTNVESVVAKAMFPLLWKLSFLSGKLDTYENGISKNYKVDYICDTKSKAETDPRCKFNLGVLKGSADSDEKTGYLFYSDYETLAQNTDYYRARDVISYLTACSNYSKGVFSEVEDVSEVNWNLESYRNQDNTLKGVPPVVSEFVETRKVGKTGLSYKDIKVKKVYKAKDGSYYPICLGDEVFLGDGLISGSENMGYYFYKFREIVKNMLLYRLSSEERALLVDGEGNNTVDFEKRIDDFLIKLIRDMHANSSSFSEKTNNNIYKYFYQNVYSTGYGKFCQRYKDDSRKDDILSSCEDTKPVTLIVTDAELAKAVKGYFKIVYRDRDSSEWKLAQLSESKTLNTSLRIEQIERLFFAFLADLSIKTEESGSSALNGSFSVNLNCAPVESGIGDPAGVKLYCSADDNQLIGVKSIIDSLERTVDLLNDNETENAKREANRDFARAGLIELILMEKKGTIPVDIMQRKNERGVFEKLKSTETTYVTIDRSVTQKMIQFVDLDNDDKETDLVGSWLVMRCPSGASCNGTQCGDCANSESANIKTTLYRLATAAEKTEYGLGSDFNDYIRFENAICENGQIKGEAQWPSTSY